MAVVAAAAVDPSSAGATSLFAFGASDDSEDVLDVDEELVVLEDASELSATTGRAGCATGCAGAFAAARSCRRRSCSRM